MNGARSVIGQPATAYTAEAHQISGNCSGSRAHSNHSGIARHLVAWSSAICTLAGITAISSAMSPQAANLRVEGHQHPNAAQHLERSTHQHEHARRRQPVRHDPHVRAGHHKVHHTQPR